MPEERNCPICGRANPVAMPRCINCGQRMAGPPASATSTNGGSSSSVLLQEQNPPTTTGLDPWWRASTGSIPLPPQAKEQALREEMARREKEKRETERRASIAATVAGQHAKQTAQAPQQVQVSVACPRCGADTRIERGGFSFCFECGADMPMAGGVAQQPRGSMAAPRAGTTASQQQATGRTHVTSAHLTSAARPEARSSLSPGATAFFSFFVPGLGQMFNGQAAKGAMLLLAMFVAFTILDFGSFGVPGIVLRAVAALDAYRIAERRRSGQAVRDGEWDLG